MTPGKSGCTKQACDFTDNLDLLAGAGYDVIGVSPDKPEKLAKFREKENLKVTLLGDPDKTVLEAYGAFGEKKLYGKTYRASSAPRSWWTRRARSSTPSTTSGPPAT